ncbi:MAG: repeat containing protein [Pedosphaera sp.]|nr:repeat containing protein [Pedosphaera sp.]
MPTTDDRVFITNSGIYSVTVDVNVTNLNSLVIGGGIGIQALVLNNKFLIVANNSQAAANGTINVNGGGIGGDGTVTVDGTLNWNAGEISKNIIVGSSGSLHIQGNGNKNLVAAQLINNGYTVWSGQGPLTGSGGAYFENNGVFELQNNEALQNGSGQATTFVNNGTLRKFLGLSTSSFSQISLVNNGILEVQTGNVAFLPGSNAVVHTFSTGSQITGLGSVLVDGASVNVAGQVTVNSSFEFRSGILNGSGAGTNALVGTVNWTGGTVSGSLAVKSGSRLNLSGSSNKNLNQANLKNYGSLSFSGSGKLCFNSSSLLNCGSLYLGSGGTFISTNGTPSSLINSGSMAFDNFPGQLNLQVPFTQTASGELTVGIGGSSSSQYDRIISNTNMDLGGNIRLKLNNLFVPSLGNQFAVLSFASETGKFAARIGDAGYLYPIYSDTNFVLGAMLPSIVQSPQSQTVTLNGSASFSVTASNASSFQWYFNNLPVLGATSSTLTLANVQNLQAGNYRAVAGNYFGTATSATANLTVYVPLNITSQPSALSVVAGTAAIFNVAVLGTGPYSYQWKFNGVSLDGATNSSLYLLTTTASQSGLYTVDIRNGTETVTSAPASLAVFLPPVLVFQPQSLAIIQGSPASFSVVATGSGLLSYQWYLDGVIIPGATNAVLLLTNTLANAAGNYTVTVSNLVGTTTSDVAALVVHVPPIITVQPQNLAAVLGNLANLSVGVIGDSPLSYQWFFNGAAITGETNSTLARPNVQATDAGNYSVTIINPYGTNNSALVTLTVNIAALISQQPADEEAIPGSTAFFSVAATGTEPISYQWRFNGTPIAGATGTGLTLTNVDVVNSGDYSVVVSNVAGADTSITAQLDVTSKVRQGWIAKYNGSHNHPDFAKDAKVDSQGNIYVTGYAEENATGQDYVTLKYNSAGVLQWRTNYNGTAGQNDQAVALALDNQGNVYVTGNSEGAGSGLDYATIKYDSNGNQLWAARYDGQSGKDDLATAIAVDASGNVYVTGASQGGSDSNFHYTTIKYDADGNRLWVSRYTGTGNGPDYAQSLAFDDSGSVYVTGKSTGNGSGFDYATVKYTPGGAQLWAARYNGLGNGDDEASRIVVDSSHNVFVTGKSKGAGTDFDYATIKYNSSGTQLWANRYNGPTDLADQAEAMALDSAGNVVVTGSSRGYGGDFDYLTLKYSPAGSNIWEARYDGPKASDDFVHALTIDQDGSVYVTGSSKGQSAGFDFETVKYSGNDGEQLWAARYSGPANQDDNGRAIALDAQHNVYVAGESKGTNSDYDYVLVQYRQPQPPVITSQPMSQAANVGDTVTFNLSVTGTQPMSFQWRLNGVNIPGETNAFLILTNVQVANSGNYQVTIANAADSVDSIPAVLTVNAAPMGLADNFGDSTVVSSLSGVGIGNNTSATQETGEPKATGKSGGKSVWFTWRAPASGVVTFSTRGSSFDTLLGVYTGTNVNSLSLVASDDDSGGFLTSLVTFNAEVGTDYHIQIDGLNGASGQIVVSWGLEITTDRIPVVTSLSVGQTVGVGEPVTFGVNVNGIAVAYQWYHNGVIITNAQSSTLQLLNVQAEDVGLYYVRLLSGTREILSKPIFIQINRTDDTVNRSVAAVDKFQDLATIGTGTGLGSIITTTITTITNITTGVVTTVTNITSTLGGLLKSISMQTGARASTTRGYSSTQIFSTYSGSTQPGEPRNCGIPGGASSWYSYTPQVNGTLYINTDGSDFDTTLGVYTGSGYDFSTLVSVACDDNSGANGKTSAVRFQAKAGTNYFISVDGKNGASGRVVLNINLGDPAAIATAPQNQIVTAGQTASLNVDASGSAPFGYEWRFNGTKIAGATNASLVISNVVPSKTGQYSVIISNLINKVSSQPASLMIASPTLSITAQPQNQSVSEGAKATFTVGASSTSAISYQWQYNGTTIAGATNSSFALSGVQSGQIGNYSVLLTDGGGSLQSTSAVLTVSPNVVIARDPASQTVGANSNLTLNVVAYGSPRLDYQWQFNKVNIAGATNASFTITNFAPANEGNYRVIVTNYASSATSQEAILMIGTPSRVGGLQRHANGSFQLQVVGLPNTTYTIQGSTNLVDWLPMAQVASTNGYINFLDTAAQQFSSRYYRVVPNP